MQETFLINIAFASSRLIHFQVPALCVVLLFKTFCDDHLSRSDPGVSWQRKLDAGEPCLGNSRTFGFWVYDRTESQAERFLRASLWMLLSAERCIAIKRSVVVGHECLGNDRAENVSKVCHRRCSFYAIFNPSRSKYWRYVWILRYTKYACVYWENLFTLIVQAEVLVSHRLSTFNSLYIFNL